MNLSRVYFFYLQTTGCPAEKNQQAYFINIMKNKETPPNGLINEAPHSE
jgi:hypothetical protein